MELKMEHVTKEFNHFKAVSDVNYTMHNGVYGLLGINGAGKTTTMRMLCTLLKPSAGRITYDGRDIFEMDGEYRKILGYLPQDFSMYPNMTVYEAMDYLGVLSGLNKSRRKERIPELLQRVNLQDDSRKKVKALSGGMKRRLGIAQAILHDPKVLIVDEPTAGLDPEERVRFRNLLCEIAEERIVILSTHIVGDIEAACENIAVLDEGEMIYKGTVSDLISMAEGKVYSAEISKRELEHLKKEYAVTSMLTLGNNVMARFLADKQPFASAKLCEAGVEDAYMYLMQTKGGGISCSDNYL